jgi:hypothetical protein
MKMEDIVTILGPTDEALIADIIRSGASADELAQAWAWVNADEALINDGRPLPSGRIAELVALLDPQEDEHGETNAPHYNDK